MLADPKPDARIVASADEWHGIVGQKFGPCRVTGETTGHIDMAHLVSRGQRGDDIPDNLIPLRHDLHMILHDHSPGWEEIAHAIRHSLTPAETAYIVSKKSRWWLNKTYPKGDVSLCARCKRVMDAAERPQEAPQAPRKRKRYVITVPDDAEDGADVLDALIDLHRARLAPELGWTDDVPPYYVLAAVLAGAL